MSLKLTLPSFSPMPDTEEGEALSPLKPVLRQMEDAFREIDGSRRKGLRFPLGGEDLPGIAFDQPATRGSGFYSLDGAYGWGLQADTARQRAVSAKTGGLFEIGPNGVPESGDRARLSIHETDPKITDDVARFDLVATGTDYRLRAWKRNAGTLRSVLFGVDDGSFTEALRYSKTEVVVNEDGLATMDLRVEGDTDTKLIFADVSADRVYMGGETAIAGEKLAVLGAVSISGANLLYFRDAALTIGSPSDGQLDIDADTKLRLDAPTVEFGTAPTTLTGTYKLGGTPTLDANVTVSEGVNFALGTATGTKIGTAADQKLSVWGNAPVARPAAYTQTYATADKTHDNFTSADLAAFTGGTVGFLDAAERDNIRTQLNALRADVADLKQLVNSIIDDMQLVGFAG